MLESEYGLTRPEFAKIEELYFKIFDGYASSVLVSSGKKSLERDSVFKLNIPLINEDPVLMKEFVGWQKFELHIYLDHISDFLIPLKQTATDLLLMLKKDYHLE